MSFKSMIFAAIIAGGTLMPVLSQANNLPQVPHVSTSGNATIKATPDMATLQIDVQVTDKNAVNAKGAVDKRVVQYFDFLTKNGVEKKDINAANVRTQPQYDYNQKTGKSTITGYSAIRSVEVKVRNLDKLNVLLDGALKAGLNEVNSVSFGVNDAQRYRDEARNNAIKNATEQANALAKGFNAHLGPVYSISYQASESAPTPMPRMKYAAATVAMDSPENNETYQQQSVEFRDQVDVVFELKR